MCKKLRKIWEGPGYLIDLCHRCVEDEAKKHIPAEEYIRAVCDLPPLAHTCGKND